MIDKRFAASGVVLFTLIAPLSNKECTSPSQPKYLRKKKQRVLILRNGPEENVVRYGPSCVRS